MTKKAGDPAGASIRSESGRFLGFTVRYAGFWLLYFLLCRLFFLGYHAAKVPDAASLFGALVYGLYIDLSATGYLCVIPYLLWFLNRFFPIPGARVVVRGYTQCAIVLVALISTSDLQIYRSWGTKINAQALGYLRHPSEAFASVSSAPLLLLVVLALVLCGAGSFLFHRISAGIDFGTSGGRWQLQLVRVPLFVFFALIIFLGIRGSVGVAPMNPSFAYFSNNQFVNHAALNTSWNLLYDVKYSLRHQGNSFVYLSESEMQARVDRLCSTGKPNETERILTTTRPNVVIFILESWTADVIGSLGAQRGITPFFEEMISQGLLFTDFYANGYRTCFGVPAVLSGYPSTPEGSILNHPLKVDKIPTLAGALKKAAYRSSFYYGGDNRFDDMNAFFLHSGFDRVVDRSAFAKRDMNSKWGAQDHVLFQRILDDLKGEPQPFFTSLLTLSSHEPFEVPMQTVYPGGDEPSLFKNAVHYTDRSLRGFFEKARKERWYKNTLFVFVADHGHSLPLNRPYIHQPERYRIPLLLYGEVLKPEYRGAKKETIGSQSDIAATLLAQLGLKHDEFLWSNNLMNRHRNDFAYYNFYTGFGFKTPQQTVVYDNALKRVIMQSVPNRSAAADLESKQDAMAYMQYLYKRYAQL